jgi:hypothetical protein
MNAPRLEGESKPEDGCHLARLNIEEGKVEYEKAMPGRLGMDLWIRTDGSPQGLASFVKVLEDAEKARLEAARPKKPGPGANPPMPTPGSRVEAVPPPPDGWEGERK